MTPLRQRLIDDLQLRNRSPRTIEVYVYHLREYARYFQKSPDQLGLDHAHRYILYLGDGRRIVRTVGLIVVWSEGEVVRCCVRSAPQQHRAGRVLAAVRPGRIECPKGDGLRMPILRVARWFRSTALYAAA